MSYRSCRSERWEANGGRDSARECISLHVMNEKKAKLQNFRSRQTTKHQGNLIVTCAGRDTRIVTPPGAKMQNDKSKNDKSKTLPAQAKGRAITRQCSGYSPASQSLTVWAICATMATAWGPESSDDGDCVGSRIEKY